MANRDELARNIFHRLVDGEHLGISFAETGGKLEARAMEMLLEEIDRFDIIDVPPVVKKS